MGNPNGICLGATGSLYLTDSDNHRIREVSNVDGVNEINLNNLISIYPNPFSIQATFHTDQSFKNATLSVDNCLGQTVNQIKNISGQTVTLFRDNLPCGLYFIRLTQDNKVVAAKKILITD